MDHRAFETELTGAGYSHIETKVIEPRPANSAHTHDYGIRGIVLDGIFIVAQRDKSVTYLPGDVFAVAQGQSHTEEIGPRGASVLLGRKY